MSRQKHQSREALPFICSNCGQTVMPPQFGTRHRNHCPHCLWSSHVDLRTGDRRSACRGAMEPIGIWVREKKDWSIIHRCQQCGFIRANRVAGDDNETLLFFLAAKPLTRLPFPAEMAFHEERDLTQGEVQ